MASEPPSIFLSLTTPYSPAQHAFVDSLEDAIRAAGMAPRSLGRNEWSNKAPLIPIRALMYECLGTIALAMTRLSITSGLAYPDSDQQQSVEGRCLSTVWIQIEAAMAFQLKQPLLILREEQVASEGVLDPRNTGLKVCTFKLGDGRTIPSSILDELATLRARVTEFTSARR